MVNEWTPQGIEVLGIGVLPTDVVESRLHEYPDAKVIAFGGLG
jgi:hypothetical protein